ncbi:MAG: guanylate kinase [Lachnospiraceae bacterium]|nr:guanylate kinase [Lachnospiraceae bacterium]
MQGKLLVISGLSAAGKGTVAKALVEKFDNYVLSISATTRERRGSEVDGVDYFFISRDDFKKRIDGGDFLEYAEYVGNFYGTPKSFVIEKLNAGINVILEIEMQGALKVKKVYDEAVLVFFLPKSAKVQKERLINRKRDDESQIKKRIQQAIVDAEYAKHYDYILINDDLEDSIRDMQKIVNGTYDKSKNIESMKILDKIVSDIREEQNV